MESSKKRFGWVDEGVYCMADAATSQRKGAKQTGGSRGVHSQPKAVLRDRNETR